MVENEIRIVLLGREGSEKISTGNTILGTKSFHASITGPTLQCSHYHTDRFNYKIVVLNTPDIFDQSASEEIVQKEIKKCILLSSPGPHAFVFVVDSTENTKDGNHFVDKFVKYLDDRIYKYMIFLYTKQDVKTDYDKLMVSVTNYEGRVMTFNNMLEGEEKNAQVKQLLKIILKIVQFNDGKTYTDENYKKAETYMKSIELNKLNEEQKQKLNEKKNHLDKIYTKNCKELENVNQKLEEMKAMVDSGCAIADIEGKFLLHMRNEKSKLLDELAEKHTEELKEVEQQLRNEFESKKKNIRDKSREDVEKERAFVENWD